MTHPSPPARRGRGRRPAEQVRQEVLRAAGELLLAEGMAGFTVEKVAALAGASRVTLHKWWPSKGALALEGYFGVVGPLLAFPDSGDIAADLTAQLKAFVRLMRDTRAGIVVPQLIGQAQTDPDLAAVYRESYSGPRRALAVQALERARRRGQLRPGLDPEVAVDQLWGACYHRLLIPDRPLDEEFAEALVANLLGGIGSPAAVSSPAPGAPVSGEDGREDRR